PTAPYAISWDTRTASNASHTLTAVATDLLGVQYTSEPVTITVFNDLTPPTVALTAPGAGAFVKGTITVSANASDNVGVVGVSFFVDGAQVGAEDTIAPYTVSWNTAGVADGPHTLTAVARDAAGHTPTSSAVMRTAAHSRPTAAITAPGAGAFVKGTVTVSASASDNVGVAGVRFFVDGAPIGVEDTIAPYAVSWNTAGVAEGPHTLTA